MDVSDPTNMQIVAGEVEDASGETNVSPPRTRPKVSSVTVLPPLASAPTSRNSSKPPPSCVPKVFCSTEICTFRTLAPRVTASLLPQPQVATAATSTAPTLEKRTIGQR